MLNQCLKVLFSTKTIFEKTNVANVGKLTNDIHHLSKISWTNIDKMMHAINQPIIDIHSTFRSHTPARVQDTVVKATTLNPTFPATATIVIQHHCKINTTGDKKICDT